ncbi:MAG: SpoIIE family protein phosphatase [Planctomycetes bacterium]|nr:SpoIIE family protein phosphatase [Planctomycetota bacterium]
MARLVSTDRVVQKELEPRSLILRGGSLGLPEYFPDVAEVFFREGEYRLRVLPAEVTTKVNGLPVSASSREGVPLTAGATIEIGGMIHLRYEETEPQERVAPSDSVVPPPLPMPRFDLFCKFAQAVGVQIDLEEGLDIALPALLHLFPHAGRAAIYLQTRPDDATWLAQPRFYRRSEDAPRPGAFSRRLASRLLDDPSCSVIHFRERDDEPGLARIDSLESSIMLAARIVPKTGESAPSLRGIVSLDSVGLHGSRPFTPEDLRIIEAAAALLGGFLQRVAFHRTAAELALAREIQKSLLPPRIPPIAGYEIVARFEPAAQVSGDFYDFQPHANGAYFLLGDVSGKSFPAALVMAQIVSTFRAHLGAGAGPAAALAAVDRELASYRALMYATAVLADISAGGPTTFYLYGHLAPYQRKDGVWRLLKVPPAALPLGLGREMDTGPIAGFSVDLGHGDALLFYSDGLTEAHGPAGDFFGTRLDSVLAGLRTEPAPLADALRAAVLEHSKGTLADDLTLVLITRNA